MTQGAGARFQMPHRHDRGTLCRVKDSPLPSVGESRFTMRLRLEPVGLANPADLWLLHSDDEVWPWCGTEKPSRDQAEQWQISPFASADRPGGTRSGRNRQGYVSPLRLPRGTRAVSPGGFPVDGGGLRLPPMTPPNHRRRPDQLGVR
jgi:hypothetical protein